MHPISGEMCLQNERFPGLNIKTGLFNVYLEQITLSLVMILWLFFSSHLRGRMLAFEIKCGTLPCVLLLPSIYTDLLPSLTQNTFSIWLSTVQMWNSWMFLNMVWVFLLFSWRRCREVHTAPDTEGEEWDVLADECERQLHWEGDILSMNSKVLW